MYVVFPCLSYVHCVHTGACAGQRSPGTGLRGTLSHPIWVLEIKKQQAVLTTGPSLQLLVVTFSGVW